MLDHGMSFAFSWFHSGCETSYFCTFSCKNLMYVITCIYEVVDRLVNNKMGIDCLEYAGELRVCTKKECDLCLDRIKC